MVSMSGLGWPSLAKPLSSGVLACLPFGEELRGGFVERGELGVAEDGGLHLGDGEPQLRSSRGG